MAARATNSTVTLSTTSFSLSLTQTLQLHCFQNVWQLCPVSRVCASTHHTPYSTPPGRVYMLRFFANTQKCNACQIAAGLTYTHRCARISACVRIAMSTASALNLLLPCTRTHTHAQLVNSAHSQRHTVAQPSYSMTRHHFTAHQYTHARNNLSLARARSLSLARKYEQVIIILC